MAVRLEGVRHVLAVASGKGGVGKTTVTVQLALALAAGGAAVGIFDADVYGPDVPLLLGVHRRESGSGLVPIARAGRAPYIEPLVRFGLKVMSFGLLIGEGDAVLSDPQLIGRAVVQTLRDVCWAPLDYLLLDLPPGTGEPQHSLLQVVQVDGVVVVTTPQALSRLDTGRSLGLFRAHRVPVLGVVENMSSLRCPHCGEAVEIWPRSPRQGALDEPGLPRLGRPPSTRRSASP